MTTVSCPIVHLHKAVGCQQILHTIGSTCCLSDSPFPARETVSTLTMARLCLGISLVAVLIVAAAAQKPTFLGDNIVPSRSASPKVKTASYGYDDTEVSCLSQLNYKNCRYTGCPGELTSLLHCLQRHLSLPSSVVAEHALSCALQSREPTKQTAPLTRLTQLVVLVPLMVLAPRVVTRNAVPAGLTPSPSSKLSLSTCRWL